MNKIYNGFSCATCGQSYCSCQVNKSLNPTSLKQDAIEKLINELEILSDSYQSRYALELYGYKEGVQDAIFLIKNYLYDKGKSEADK